MPCSLDASAFARNFPVLEGATVCSYGSDVDGMVPR